ncbi:von Willebrand factor A domain-containing protein 7 [Hyalella azteca]|uniref:von Willebrand factor A domain-containing protein 7 n=1 Tax=Hyalella azteca TaxID=294128 RepID=A0A8B7N9Z9_HYAAZ|nr:von Willebrand factor A domain-containing protein 7 [Hyalella azteca]
MTLEEAYRAYNQYEYGYGNSHPSTKRLQRALQDIADAAAETHEGGMGTQPMYHFNNEQFETSHAVLQARWGRLVGALKSFDVTATRYLLGTSLAALQDFYAHSNWIELGHDSILEDLGLPGGTLPEVARFDEETCTPCHPTGTDCSGGLTDTVLTSGILTSDYLAAMETIPLSGKCQLPPRQVGRTQRVEEGISKDLPSACFSPRPDLHDRAATLAAQATSHYLNELRRAVGNQLFSHLLSLHWRPPVAIVTDSGINLPLTTWSNPVDKQPSYSTSYRLEPEEYIFVMYSNTLRGATGVFLSLIHI